MKNMATNKCQQKGISLIEILLFTAIVAVGSIATAKHGNRMQEAAEIDETKLNVRAALNAMDLVYYQYCAMPNPKPVITPAFVVANTHLRTLGALQDPATNQAFGLSIDWDYPTKTRVVINNINEVRANQVIRSLGVGVHDVATSTLVVERIPRLSSPLSEFASASPSASDPATRPCNI